VGYKRRRGWEMSRKTQNIALAVLAFLAAAAIVWAAIPKAPPVSNVPEYTPPPVAEKPVAIFFGDSYFNGSAPVTARQTFASVAGRTLGYDVAIRGFGGTGFIAERTVKPAMPNYAAQIKDGEFEVRAGVDVPLVVVQGGIMDQRYADYEVEDAVVGVLESAREAHPDANLVLVGPADVYTPESESIVRVEEAMGAAAKAEDVPFIRIRDLVSRKELLPLIGEDEIHPTKEGHKLLGERLAAQLVKVGVKDLSED